MTRMIGALAIVLLAGSVSWVQADGGCMSESLRLGLTTVTVDGEPSSAEALGWSETVTLDVDIYGEGSLEMGPHFFDTTGAVSTESVKGSGCGSAPDCARVYSEGTTALSGGDASLTVGADTVSLDFTADDVAYAVDFEILEVIGYY